MAPALDRLRSRSNVHYLGPVSYDRVPDILNRFDVGLIPFVVSDYTRAVNPIKMYEYAIFNMPIVSSAFSPDVSQFAHSVDVCDDIQSFVCVVTERINGQGLRD